MKLNRLLTSSLRIFLFAISFSCFFVVLAQPLSGNYTIGGSNPDFTTLQHAADALNARGVAGAVFFNIRQGTYLQNGGNNTVLLLDSTVADLSSTNRITFQADASSGGNVDNVILQMNRTNVTTADFDLVKVRLDFITFRNLTFSITDSLNTFNNYLVHIEQENPTNLIVEDIVFEGCKFLGTTHIGAPGNSLGTVFGIGSDTNVGNITIRGNTFVRLLNAVSVNNALGVAQGTIIVEDNQFLEGYSSSSGSGNALGAAIQISCTTASVRRNKIDFTTSYNAGGIGIFVAGANTAFVESNDIRGPFSVGLQVTDFGSALADSIYIYNNMILGGPVNNRIGLQCNSKNANIHFNTIKLPSAGVSTTGLLLESENCKIINNMIIIYSEGGFSTAYNQSASALNLQSDYNIISKWGSGQGPIVIRNGIQYYSFLDYQNATGLDTNSAPRLVEFVAYDDLHLTDCQSQDPDFRGIPIPGITLDIDGEIRHETSPLIGADENLARFNDSMFGAPFKIALPGPAFSIAVDNFAHPSVEGFAIPDYDNNQVLLYNYNGDRTFSHTGTLQTLFPPTEVKFFDFDKDNNLDLLVGLDATMLQIFWGNGIGGFPTSTNLLTAYSVETIEIGNDNSLQEPQVFLIFHGFLTATDYYSLMAYIVDDFGRENIEVVYLNEPGSNTPDTIYTSLGDMAIGNIDDEPNDEIVALSILPPFPVYIFNDTTVSGVQYPYSTHYSYVFGSHPWSPWHNSSIRLADIDGDGDNDILTTSGSTDEIVLIRNLGNYGFADEEILVREARGLVVMDYENDGDQDIVTMNHRLETNGITVFLNDGSGNFTTRENCFFPHANGFPWSMVASDFDNDGRTDIAISAVGFGSADSLFVLYNLGGGTVGIDEQETEEIPTTFSLSQNYPNPFNPTTTIKYSIPNAGLVTLTVFNILGEQIKTLINQEMPAGNHTVQFNASSLASGIYLYRIQSGSFIQTKKMLLLK